MNPTDAGLVALETELVSHLGTGSWVAGKATWLEEAEGRNLLLPFIKCVSLDNNSTKLHGKVL